MPGYEEVVHDVWEQVRVAQQAQIDLQYHCYEENVKISTCKLVGKYNSNTSVKRWNCPNQLRPKQLQLLAVWEKSRK